MPKKYIAGMLSSIPEAHLITQLGGLDLTADTDFVENEVDDAVASHKDANTGQVTSLSSAKNAASDDDFSSKLQ